jgi:hypothetical protein
VVGFDPRHGGARTVVGGLVLAAVLTLAVVVRPARAAELASAGLATASDANPWFFLVVLCALAGGAAFAIGVLLADPEEGER